MKSKNQVEKGVFNKAIYEKNESAAVKALKDSDFDVNFWFGKTEKRTPLMIAARNGMASLVLALLQHGAKVFQKNSAGKNALDYARMSKNEETINYIAGAMGVR